MLTRYTRFGFYFGIAGIAFHSEIYLILSIILLYIGIVVSKMKENKSDKN